LNIVTGNHLKCKFVLYSGKYIMYHLNNTTIITNLQFTSPVLEGLKHCLLNVFLQKSCLYNKPRGYIIRNGSYPRDLIPVSLQYKTGTSQCESMSLVRNWTHEITFCNHKVQRPQTRKVATGPCTRLVELKSPELTL
jgi:hypothetical protein